MGKSIAKIIAGWSCQSQKDNYEETSAILYGIEIIIETLLKTLILVCIAIYLHQEEVAFITLFSFCIVRIHAGGIHAKTSLGCTVFMVAIEIGCILCNRFVEMPYFTYPLIIILSNILLWLYAPNGSESCELLSDIQNKKKRQYAICIANVLFGFGILTGMEKLVFMPVFIEVLTLLLYELRKERYE